MISSLNLINFKCFEDQSFELGNLTLLTGLNGTGKSSVIQSLLLLRQSYQHRFLQDRTLLLNGDLLQLGTAKDALFEGSKRDEFGFDLDFSGTRAKWQFKYTKQEDMDQPTSDVVQRAPQLISDQVCDKVYETSLFGDNFHYLPADRTGPQPGFEIPDYAFSERQQLGVKGEYAPDFLSRFGETAEKTLSTADQRGHCEAITCKLIDQVQAWMGEISPGIRIDLSDYSASMGRINLQYFFSIGRATTNAYRSTNVGFGITYTLPILLALLASRKDTLVLLENPEAHLHPRGQFQLGELIARAASCGIQVIVESHSDHILNGIRVAVRQGIIEPDKVRLYYLSRSVETNQFSSEVISPRIDKDGRIDEWPDGFFDEWEKGLEQLF